MNVELVVDAHAQVGEGLVWNSLTQRMVWVDILGRRVHQFDPASGRNRTQEAGAHVGTAVPRARGGLVLAIPDGFVALDDGGRVTRLASVEADDPRTRFNDGKCDSQGRLWAGTMSRTEDAALGTLYRLDANLSVHPMLAGVTVSNGIAWSPDDRVMYYIDSPTRRVDAFDFDPAAGALSNRRPLVRIPADLGLPDGMAADADGYLWVALFGGGRVQRFAPDGVLDREVELPATYVTSCGFGGPDLDDLYITTATRDLSEDQRLREPHAGGLFRVRPGVRGLPARAFAG